MSVPYCGAACAHRLDVINGAALLDEAVLNTDAQHLTLACHWQALVYIRCAICVSPSECSPPHRADPSWT